MKTNQIKTKVIGTILAAVCAASSVAALSSVCAYAISTSSSDTTAAAVQDEPEPTVDKEPGIYPIDNDHFLIVYSDHTFRLVHGEPPTTNPWTIA